MLPESCTLYSEAPMAVARMHSPAGSSGYGSAAGIDAPADRAAQAPPEVAEVALLAAVDVFGDAAREHHAGDALDGLERIGEPERIDGRGRGLDA